MICCAARLDWNIKLSAGELAGTMNSRSMTITPAETSNAATSFIPSITECRVKMAPSVYTLEVPTRIIFDALSFMALLCGVNLWRCSALELWNNFKRAVPYTLGFYEDEGLKVRWYFMEKVLSGKHLGKKLLSSCVILCKLYCFLEFWDIWNDFIGHWIFGY